MTNIKSIMFSTIFLYSSVSAPVSAGPLEDINLANQVAASVTAGDLAAAYSNVTKIEDPTLRDIWLANIILKSLELGDCSAAETAHSDMIDESLKSIYGTNISLRC